MMRRLTAALLITLGVLAGSAGTASAMTYDRPTSMTYDTPFMTYD